MAMETLVLAFPLLPGKASQLKEFLRDHSSDVRKRLERLHVHKQVWYLQATERDGGVIIIYTEADDPRRQADDFKLSTDLFDKKCKDHFKEGTGREIDRVAYIGATIPAMIPEQVFVYQSAVV
jgi:hypothetical protein